MMAQGGPLLELLWTLVATLGFALLFQLRGRALILAGLCGTLAWAAWIGTAMLTGPGWWPNFVAALVLTLAAELLAQFTRTVTVAYLVPGLIPLVPGSQIYMAMEAAVGRNLPKALDYGFETLAIAMALVMGVLVVSVLMRLLGLHGHR